MWGTGTPTCFGSMSLLVRFQPSGLKPNAGLSWRLQRVYTKPLISADVLKYVEAVATLARPFSNEVPLWLIFRTRLSFPQSVSAS
jgi:hypothetical protein